MKQSELDLLPRELKPRGLGRTSSFLPLENSFPILVASQIGPISLIVSMCPDEEAAEIKEEGLAVEREIDDAKFKHRQRSVESYIPA